MWLLKIVILSRYVWYSLIIYFYHFSTRGWRVFWNWLNISSAGPIPMGEPFQNHCKFEFSAYFWHTNSGPREYERVFWVAIWVIIVTGRTLRIILSSCKGKNKEICRNFSEIFLKFAEIHSKLDIFHEKRGVVTKNRKIEQYNHHHCLPWCIMDVYKFTLKGIWTMLVVLNK